MDDNDGDDEPQVVGETTTAMKDCTGSTLPLLNYRVEVLPMLRLFLAHIIVTMLSNWQVMLQLNIYCWYMCVYSYMTYLLWTQIILISMTQLTQIVFCETVHFFGILGESSFILRKLVTNSSKFYCCIRMNECLNENGRASSSSSWSSTAVKGSTAEKMADT